MKIADPKALARLVKRLKKKCAEDERGGREPPTPRELDELLAGTEALLRAWTSAMERIDQMAEEHAVYVEAAERRMAGEGKP